MMKTPNIRLSLEDLLELVPGYVRICVHTNSNCWDFSAGEIQNQPEEVRKATVTYVSPLYCYILEIAVEGRLGDEN